MVQYGGGLKESFSPPPVVRRVQWHPVLVAPSQGAARLLLLLGSVVAGTAQRLVVLRLPELPMVTLVRLDVVHDRRAGAPPYLSAEGAERVASQIGGAVLLPPCVVATLSRRAAAGGHRRSLVFGTGRVGGVGSDLRAPIRPVPLHLRHGTGRSRLSYPW